MTSTPHQPSEHSEPGAHSAEHSRPAAPDPSLPAEEREAAERAAFRVGGWEEKLSPEEQLEQLASYLDAHHPLPDLTPPWQGGSGDPTEADNYFARLPDRSTHSAMLMLGSGLDHAMPGVAFPGGVTLRDLPGQPACILEPSSPTGRWAVSLHGGGWWRGSGTALDMQWRPEVAGAAELSGTTIIDLDYPLLPAASLSDILDAVSQAIRHARLQGAQSVSLWGADSGAALALLLAEKADSLVLTFPELQSLGALPESAGPLPNLPEPERWPRTLVQIAEHDELAEPPASLPANATVRAYISQHWVSTPEVARQRITDVAEFLKEG